MLMTAMDGSWCPGCGYALEPGTRFCVTCGQPVAAAAGAPPSPAAPPTVTMQSQAAGFPPAQPPGYQPYPPPAPGAPGYPPAPPASDSRLPWPPPPGSQPPASLPPAGQAPPPGGYPPGGPPQVYGAPVPADTQFDTQRMLQPQGLFQSPRPPQPWPAAGP